MIWRFPGSRTLSSRSCKRRISRSHCSRDVRKFWPEIPVLMLVTYKEVKLMERSQQVGQCERRNKSRVTKGLPIDDQATLAVSSAMTTYSSPAILISPPWLSPTSAGTSSTLPVPCLTRPSSCPNGRTLWPTFFTLPTNGVGISGQAVRRRRIWAPSWHTVRLYG
jgi:hypothetical protein